MASAERSTLGLSPAQVEHYWQHGYVIVPNVLERSEIDRYLSRATRIAHGDHPPDAANRLMRDIRFAKRMLPMPADPEHALWKIMNPDRFDPCLAECLRLPRLLDAVESLLGEDFLAFLLMFIYKPPGVPEAIHPFHQDGVFFQFQPHDLVVGAWLPLDPVAEENGTLCVVPGSHRLPIIQHEFVEGVNKNAIAARGVEADVEAQRRAHFFELPAGDCILFHPHLYHRTGGNQTERHRRVVTLHFASARCHATTDNLIREFAFTSVRGRTYEGCLQPLDAPDLGFRL